MLDDKNSLKLAESITSALKCWLPTNRIPIWSHSQTITKSLYGNKELCWCKHKSSIILKIETETRLKIPIKFHRLPFHYTTIVLEKGTIGVLV